MDWKIASLGGNKTPGGAIGRACGLHKEILTAWAGALAFHFCLYCAVAGCFAFGLYYLMQPTRLAYPGLAAYKPPARHGHCSRCTAEARARGDYARGQGRA
jgi:hypothetical protein